MMSPAKFNLTSLNGKNGFSFVNDLSDLSFGQIASNLGDINNDGKSDLIVASAYSNQAYVLFGADRFPPRIYTSNLNSTNGFLVIGGSDEGLGCAAGGIGDINGDGVDDFIVGSCDIPRVYIPQAYIIFGASNFPPRFSVSTLNGENGFKIIGHKGCGFNGADRIGDINGDGKGDFILGNIGQYMNYNISFVIYGAREFDAVLDLSKLNGENGFTVVGPSINYYGAFVAGVGDFNGDLRPDFLIGMGWIQQAVVIFGADSFPAVVRTSSLNGTNGFTIIGMHGDQEMVAAIGDINGDHFHDLSVGFFAVSEVFLILGARYFNATLNVSSLDGSNGIKLVGFSYSDFGMDISRMGSLNHNGKSGVIVGAPQEDSDGAGSAFIFFGADHFPPALYASRLNGTNGFEIIGPSNALLGWAVAGIDNFTGAGDTTIIIGAPMQNTTYVILDASMI